MMYSHLSTKSMYEAIPMHTCYTHRAMHLFYTTYSLLGIQSVTRFGVTHGM